VTATATDMEIDHDLKYIQLVSENALPDQLYWFTRRLAAGDVYNNSDIAQDDNKDRWEKECTHVLMLILQRSRAEYEAKAHKIQTIICTVNNYFRHFQICPQGIAKQIWQETDIALVDASIAKLNEIEKRVV
jgi:hypothetical protein